MKLKILLIAIIIILLIFIGLNYIPSTQNQVKVMDTYFTIPEGYSVIEEDSYINLTNGNDSICIEKRPITNITQDISDYKYEKSKDNYTVQLSKFYVGDTIVHKSQLDNTTNTLHYWFKINNTRYSIFTWSGNSNSDKLVSELITCQEKST